MTEKNPPIQFTAGQIATLVCQLEVATAKPGNVHRGADFEDVALIDFLNSGVALGHAIDESLKDPSGTAAAVGQTILSAVKATRWITDTNTNLGIVLLLCPLASLYRSGQPLEGPNLTTLLQSLTPADSRAVYEAIALARPGAMRPADTNSGLGSSFDVNDPAAAPDDLLAAMKLAADEDMIARQYVTGFADVFDFVWPAIQAGLSRLKLLSSAVIFAHVKTMAQFPDSLIARKLGTETAIKSAGYAQRAIDAFNDSPNDDRPFWDAVGDLDFWLRSDHHRRNPGTTADLITAALFVGVATEGLTPPFR